MPVAKGIAEGSRPCLGLDVADQAAPEGWSGRLKTQDLEERVFASVRSSVRPPTWRRGESRYTYFLTAGEPCQTDYIEACRCADATGHPNPRVLTPAMASWASLFQPAFFAAAKRWTNIGHLSFTAEFPPMDEVGGTAHWVGSTVFLAGVTLSAAIIQNRFSAGTLISKLDRLWHTAVAADAAMLAEVKRLDLRERVKHLSQQLHTDALGLLLGLKTVYAQTLEALGPPLPASWDCVSEVPLDRAMRRRFGFRERLVDDLAGNVVCIVVYGSSVNSESFSDYDLVVVVKDREAALRSLAGTSPRYAGIELNISVFDEAEFKVYQAFSGDNLSHLGMCVWGEIRTPRKATPQLLHRNFSFGYVRMRQIIGMRFPVGGEPPSATPERRNLHGYFSKIPINVSRGLRGALGEKATKEQLLRWARESLGYELATDAEFSVNWRAPLASAAWATHATLAGFNADYCVYTQGERS